MKIVVLLKRVPDTATRIRVAGVAIDPTGVEFVISPYDEMALERALQLRDASEGTLTVVTLGPPEAVKEIRTALAMGADRGVLLTDDAPLRDAASTAEALAGAVSDLEPDLVLCGWKAVDTDDAGVPHLVAGRLGLACVTFATKLEVEAGVATIHREVEGATEVVRASLPLVVTAQKGLAEPRFPSMKGIMMAKRKPIDTRESGAPASRLRILSMAPPPERRPGRILGEGVDAVPELVRVLAEEQQIL